jgi:folate-binding protein YgfZ
MDAGLSQWNDYLADHGMLFQTNDTAQAGVAVGPLAPVLGNAALAGGFVAVIQQRGVIAVTGEDAATFLHNQLTNDVEHLGPDAARLAAYCSPKGRMQASFLMWRNDSTIYLQLAAELQPALQKRLSMFVLRAKAKLADAGAAAGLVTLGFGGAVAAAALTSAAGQLPGGPYGKTDSLSGTIIRVADAFGAPRYLWLTDPETALAALPVLRASLALGGDQAWDLADIHAGVPWITAPTVDQFVPQMVNFELLGGVNFKKGCYPGQEIVARSQYLGKLKRRTALATVAAPARAGEEVFADSDPGQPCGMVVNAAYNREGGTDLLVELKLAALGGDTIRLAGASGPALHLLTMPYPLDAIEV